MTGFRDTRNYYDSFSSNYDSFYREIQIEKFAHMLGDLEVKEWSLDFGAGTGMLSEWLSYPLLSLDISYEMLLRGIEHGGEFLAVAGAFEWTPFRKNSIQQILSFSALHNAVSPTAAINNVCRIAETEMHGTITFLRKTKKLDEIRIGLQDFLPEFYPVPFHGEDFCYRMSSSSNSTGSKSS